MQAVIIAAGESTRFWPLNNSKHKSQFTLLGKSLLYWNIKGLVESGIRNIVVVVANHSSVQDMLAKENDLGVQLTYVVQKDPLGTGNALWQAKNNITESFVLVWGNKVGSKELVRRMKVQQEKDNSDAVLVGMHVDNPAEYGVFRFEGERIAEIIENPQEGTAPSNIAFVGARILGPDFFAYYEKLERHHEADLVEATNAYIQDKSVSFVEVNEQGLTLKYPWDLFNAMDVLFLQQKPYIAKTAIIGKNVVIDGPVYIGENCIIGHHNVLRGPLVIEAGCKTAAFMEIKHSIIQEGTIFHSGYVGDSIIGKNCRFGAGFATGNLRLDKEQIHGLRKLGAVIGDNAIFGIHSGTMPGVLVGSNCIVGPGTHVFETLHDNTTIYAKQEIITKQTG